MIRGFEKAQRDYENQTPYDNDTQYFCPNCKNFVGDEDYNSDTNMFYCSECGFEFESGDSYSKYDVLQDGLDFEADRLEDIEDFENDNWLESKQDSNYLDEREY